MRTRIVILGSVALLLVASRAAAGETLRIETLEERSWSAAVAALQKDRASEGKVIHVVVRESDGTRVKCGSYAIGLDVASAEAFQSEGCDPASDSTALRLVHRAALFDHSESVSKPRAPRIVASRTQTGEASGGAKNGVESSVDCQVTVHPFIRDLENGARIDLTPSHYALHTKSDDVRVKPTDDGWVFVAPRGTTSQVRYTVTDLKKGEVVLDDRVSMNCSAQSQVGTSAPDPEPIPTIRSSSSQPIDVKPYEPPPDADRPNEDFHASGPWNGYAVTANFGIGSAFMRTTGVRYGNDAGGTDANGLGLHDAAGPVLLASVAYERPGLYGAFGASAGEATMNKRTLWNLSATSVVAPALHLGDVSLYLGPNVQVGSYQVSADTSETLAYGSKVAFTLGGAAGGRYHVRDEKTGKLAYVLGIELVAPVAGPAPWFLTAQIAFGK